jgi:hypothetical protein
MIYLPTTTDKIEVVLSVAANVDVVSSWAEADSTGSTNPSSGYKTAAITTTAATDISGSPAASRTRNLKQTTIRNRDTSVSPDVLIRLNANGTIYEIHKVTLAPGQCLIYIEGVGFFTASNLAANRLLSSLESSGAQRIFQSRCTEGSTFLAITGTAYYVYMGRAVQDITVKFIEWQTTGTVAAGAQTAEAGLFSTPAAPNKSAQTLTKIAATGTVDSQTTNGMKRNTASFAQLVQAGVHLWAAVRFAMATTQPTAVGLANDMSQGQILTTTGGGALTGLTTAAGSIPALATATVAPALRVTMD